MFRSVLLCCFGCLVFGSVSLSCFGCLVFGSVVLFWVFSVWEYFETPEEQNSVTLNEHKNLESKVVRT